MTFKQLILSSATATSILLTASFLNTPAFTIMSQAQAATNVSVDVSIGTFYDTLSSDGSWVSYQDQYVWLPENVSENWRPYTEGHWSYTRRYGWLWVSNERFGWATYHYGRWGYARDIGWYWVPGRRWAPAWVAWSHADNAIAWAPLPPRHDDDVTISISFGDVPDYYWQAVPASAFLSLNLSSQISRDRNYVRTVVESSPPQTVIIQNNTVVNNVINIGFVEQQTKTKVVVHEEQSVNNPAAVSSADGATVAIFNPEVKPDTTAKPANVKTVDVVAQDRSAKGVVPLAPAADQSKPAAKASDGTTAPAVKSDAPVVDPNAPKKVATPPEKASDSTATPAVKPVSPVVDPNAPKKDAAAPAKPVDNTALPTAKTTAPVVDPNTAKVDKSAKTDVPQPAKPIIDPKKIDQQNSGQQKIDKMKVDPGQVDQSGSKNTMAAPAAKPGAPAVKDVKQNNNAVPAPVDAKKPKVGCDPSAESCPPAN